MNNEYVPSQNVSLPLHCLLGWHRLSADPLKVKPSSHRKITLLGYVVKLPDSVPFSGTDKVPQSLAKLEIK